ncbi:MULTISPECIES: helix-turn-helix domain-containing protein [Aeromonas]|uniref:helix-turn-helix domain-containing protein n=1 Tax=Aeromonas TaxID=642 RepID=UPI0009BD316C|nr:MULTISPECIES: helix-turn-helix domain-containing protein [Aeromonas]ELM3753214.1 helix-turn-helix domain-containing protein [Aeromonas dhakensis]
MNQKKTESNFFRAFDEIYKIKKINGITFNLNHKSVYCFLLNYQMMSGKVFPSYKHIQDNLGIGSDNTVKKYLDELEEMGLVKATSRKGTSKIYELVTLADFNALDTEEQQTRKQPNKNLHIKPVQQKETQPIANPVNQHPVSVELDELYDPFLDDCMVSHDSAFEEYTQPTPIKSVKQSPHHEPGRLCDKCFKDSKGDWDCRDSYCDNCIPF